MSKRGKSGVSSIHEIFLELRCVSDNFLQIQKITQVYPLGSENQRYWPEDSKESNKLITYPNR